LNRKRLNRVGCGCLLVLWFGFLIIVPCGVVNLLFNNEIVIRKSAVPDDELRIWMISSTENRGVGFSNGYITRNQESEVCTRTDLRFFLWQGAAPEKDKSCTCYQKSGAFYNAMTMDTQACFELK